VSELQGQLGHEPGLRRDDDPDRHRGGFDDRGADGMAEDFPACPRAHPVQDLRFAAGPPVWFRVPAQVPVQIREGAVAVRGAVQVHLVISQRPLRIRLGQPPPPPSRAGELINAQY
jgi:hypothetical protein